MALKEGEYDHSDPSIKLSVLQKLPRGAYVACVQGCRNMDDEVRDCLIVIWTDQFSVRKAMFDKETGAYVGEMFLESSELSKHNSSTQ